MTTTPATTDETFGTATDVDLEHDAKLLTESRSPIARELGARARRELDRRRLQRDMVVADQPAHPGRPLYTLIDEINGQHHGLPCTIDEADDKELAAEIWRRAIVALESITAGEPTNRAVAEHTAAVYSTLWQGPTGPTRAERQAAIDGAHADADAFEASRKPIDLDAAVSALLILITDHRIRVHLDPKALDQARTALGIAD